eukprot:jgi/Tetstr1/463636/TSEL_008497.t1
MPDNSGNAPSGLAEDRIAALEAGFAGLTELLEALWIWEEWAHLIGPGFSVKPNPGLSLIPQLYDISYDETHRQLIARRHMATLDQYRSLYCFGFYDAVAHTALCEALASIKRAASVAQPPVAHVVRRSLLKPGFADYGSEALAQLSDELFRREAEYNVIAAAKAAVQKRFGNWREWRKIGASGRVLRWVREGVPLPFSGAAPTPFHRGVSLQDATPQQLEWWERESRLPGTVAFRY